MSTVFSIARLINPSSAFNVLNVRTAAIYLQLYPGVVSNEAGIEGARYEVHVDNTLIQSGQSAADGRIDVIVFPGKKTVLKALGSEYEVTISNAAFDPVTTHKGRKERLRSLGYQIGRHGAGADGVDTDTPPRYEYERAVLDFEGQHSMNLDATPASIDANLQADAGS